VLRNHLLFKLAIGLLLPLCAATASAAGKPMAVWFYADWCTNCKLIAPKIAQVQPEFENEVDFVKLDVTNEERKTKTREIAKQRGIFPLYFNNKATGWIALIDSSGEKIGELRHTMTVEEMRAELSKLRPAPDVAPVSPVEPAATPVDTGAATGQ
jgi:thiol-disulfide isomerase/thioredoxin